MVLRPYDIVSSTFAAKASKYTPGTQKYQNFLDTYNAKRYNSFKVPALACYVIWCCFALVVVLSALSRLISKVKRTKFLDRHLTQAPFLSRKHQQPYRFLGLNLYAPLRGHALVLIGLFLANLIPMVADYQILDPARNVNWPNNKGAQVARYVSDRAATMATLQLPLMVMLAARSGPVALVTGARFHTLMIYHKFFALLFGILTVVHGVCMITYGALYGNGQLQKYGRSLYARMGFAAAVLIVLQVVFSTRPLRHRAYEIFVALHVIVAVAVLIGLWYHITLLDEANLADFSNGIIVACAFWGFDVLARLVRMAYLTPFTSSLNGMRGQVEMVQGASDDTEQVLRVTVNVDAGRAKPFLTPGRHIYLHAPGIQFLAAHPFSVADWTQESHDARLTQLVLFARVKKGLTKTLARHALAPRTKDPIMLVEGFYGIEDHEVSSVDNVLLAAGGIGITHCLSYAVERLRQGKRVHLLWTLRDASLAAIGLDILERAAMQTDKSARSLCTLSIHITGRRQSMISSHQLQEKESHDEAGSIATRRPSTEKTTSIEMEDINEKGNHLAHLQARYEAMGLGSVTWHDERPNVAAVMNEAQVPFGAVVSCGGPAFCDEVRLQALQRGAALYEEPFGW